MKKIIQKIFHSFGLELRRRQPAAPRITVAPVKGEHTMEAAMLRAKNKLGVAPSGVIDLGAAAGTWTLKAQAVWKDADYILFEPLEERKNELEELAKKNPRIHPVFAAVGNRTGKVAFSVSDDLDGSGVYDAEKKGGNREVDLVTIDSEMERLSMRPPYIIKFDTHGYELPILEGAQKTLSQTTLVIMECYGFRISENCLIFHEMCAKMDSLGFRLADIVDIMRRPGDDMFWQCDAFFLPKTHPCFLRTTYAE